MLNYVIGIINSLDEALLKVLRFSSCCEIGLALVQSNTTLWLYAIVAETENGRRLLPNFIYNGGAML